ncbi:hypothetical protein AA313_de0200461 [Arthrobotrys entomopaga]|nr:hypothetical protein AA313_de0200461 [Arthrobotrys entomopaga]
MAKYDFFNFPAEIWLEILSYMPVEDLIPFSTFSKACRDLARPYIFESLRFSEHAVTQDSSCLGDIGQHVRHLILKDGRKVDETYDSEDMIRLCKLFTSNLHLFPNVTNLHIEYKSRENFRPYLDTAVLSHIQSSPFYDKLTKLTAIYWSSSSQAELFNPSGNVYFYQPISGPLFNTLPKDLREYLNIPSSYIRAPENTLPSDNNSLPPDKPTPSTFSIPHETKNTLEFPIPPHLQDATILCDELCFQRWEIPGRYIYQSNSKCGFFLTAPNPSYTQSNLKKLNVKASGLYYTFPGLTNSPGAVLKTHPPNLFTNLEELSLHWDTVYSPQFSPEISRVFPNITKLSLISGKRLVDLWPWNNPDVTSDIITTLPKLEELRLQWPHDAGLGMMRYSSRIPLNWRQQPTPSYRAGVEGIVRGWLRVGWYELRRITLVGVAEYEDTTRRGRGKLKFDSREYGLTPRVGTVMVESTRGRTVFWEDLEDGPMWDVTEWQP